MTIPTPDRVRELLAAGYLEGCRIPYESMNDIRAILAAWLRNAESELNAAECERICPSPKTFKQAIRKAINQYSMERFSDTPDFQLAEYLESCLTAYSTIVKARDKWFSYEPWNRAASAATQPPTPPLDSPTPSAQAKCEANTALVDHRHTAEQRRMVDWYKTRLAKTSQTCGWGLDKRGERFVTEYAQTAWNAWQEAKLSTVDRQQGSLEDRAEALEHVAANAKGMTETAREEALRKADCLRSLDAKPTPSAQAKCETPINLAQQMESAAKELADTPARYLGSFAPSSAQAKCETKWTPEQIRDANYLIHDHGLGGCERPSAQAPHDQPEFTTEVKRELYRNPEELYIGEGAREAPVLPSAQASERDKLRGDLSAMTGAWSVADTERTLLIAERNRLRLLVERMRPYLMHDIETDCMPSYCACGLDALLEELKC